MSPGSIFFTASDDVILYGIPDDQREECQKKCLTMRNEPTLVSLAHPSTLQIGTGSMPDFVTLMRTILGHGVFVFPEDTRDLMKSKQIEAGLLTNCRKVLQKPSEEVMKSAGAVTKDDIVWTDSAYWINRKLVLAFIALAKESEGWKSMETSIYSDFMTKQGTEPDQDKNDSQGFLAKVCEVMMGTKLAVLALSGSTFYHLGTSAECLEAMCKDEQLRKSLSLDIGNSSVIMASKEALSCLPKFCIVEHSKISVDLNLSEETILSCVTIDERRDVQIPGKSLYHTIAIKWHESVK